MNLDLTIHRMAFREARTLGVAQVLVAQKRADLQHDLTLKQANEGQAPAQSDVEQLVADMDAASKQRAKAAGEHTVDKTA
jgi:hypothetical protein